MKQTVYKDDFVARAAAKSGMTKVDVEKALFAIMESVEEILVEGNEVCLKGFGTFYPHFQKGKKGTFPGTNRTYETFDKFVPKFDAGKKLKDRLFQSTASVKNSGI